MHNPEDDLVTYSFRVEQWSDDDMRVVAILAACINIKIAQAAYAQALIERPTNIVRLRNKAAVVEERFPAGLPKEGR